ncbi:endonuclease domain-containing protein [Fodinibius halophilus]|uniref:Endonuclease domain-containing protein n=1 Tax=Fodinibius halophilus TaxID=1736908 RepID=A0A6M1SSI1_9BACT|nr:endonuclease domain-containing protein [Fodinibius halophilus]NGP86888.1 endonuclease domain-containing protein [Fodinibius halophilus]
MNTFKSIKELARKLRKNPTDSERKLWEVLRKRRLNGCKFLRQHPITYKQKQDNIYFFIADFYCAEKKLVIELDGKIHDFQRNYDEQRDLILQKKGLTVLRLNNNELSNLKAVRTKILHHLN